MQFVCKNISCAISTSKATFPLAMNCPLCQNPLIVNNNSINLSPEDTALINSLPYVISYPLKRTLLENHPWSKINLLKDTFLNYLKYFGLITASEFFNSSLKDKKMVALFQQALAQPSFGSWNQYIRETLNYLNENNHQFFCPDLLSYYELVETGKKRKLFKGEIEYIDSNGDVQLKKQEATAIGMLINFRNRFLGHGLTLDETSSQKLWEEYYPYFKLLLEQLSFAKNYPMFKQEHGVTFKLQSAELISIEKESHESARVWIESPAGDVMDILPFYVVPGEVSINKEDKEQILAYESYTGKTIKFFSPEGTEKQTSGKILERLNLLLRDKLKEEAYSPEQFTKEIFTSRIESENKLLLDILIAEKKVIPGVYVHREEFEIKLREWIGARANIFFIAAEAGSGKTNLLVEIQKQYQERDYSSMIIRAGRMEKTSLKKQIAYILNIDENTDISEYKAITGTQDKPVIILIDGLNEASNAEAIWQEIIELSKQFEPGSLKFVISSRANTKADINRFIISAEEENFIYGEKKENEKGLSAYCHWLTALNMVEMKNAWENYMSKDKSKFKPQFTFDDLATFDRALYNQINNPLILRLFLEIYNGKSLPKKGNKHLNIWGDWLNTFTEAEQTFFKLIANEIWIKGENELLLDDLLNNPNLKPYFTTDVINAPYPRLKNNGWISRYVKDLNSYVAFTVEGALLYLLGLKLQQQNPALDLNSVHEILADGNKLKRSAIESFLSRESLEGRLELVCEIIDAYEEHHDLCLTPLLYFLKAFGPKAMLDIVLANPTDNDWKVLFNLDEILEEFELSVSRHTYLSEIMQKNKFTTKKSLLIALKSFPFLGKEFADKYLHRIDINSEQFKNNAELLGEMGHVQMKMGELNTALEFYKKCNNNVLETLGSENIEIAKSNIGIGFVLYLMGEYDKAIELFQKSLIIMNKINNVDYKFFSNLYNNIGLAFNEKGEYDKALEFYEKSLNIDKVLLGSEHTSIASSINNIGVTYSIKGEYKKALDYYRKSLEIELKINGPEHPNVAINYCNIAAVLDDLEDYETALEYYQKCLEIELKIHGPEHPDLATTYENIGVTKSNKGEVYHAIEAFNKSIEIKIKSLGPKHPSLSKSYNNIATIFRDSFKDYNRAIDYYMECISIAINSYGDNHPYLSSFNKNIGITFKYKGEFEKALSYITKSLEISISNFGVNDNRTKEIYVELISIYKILDNHNEIPYWIKELNIK